ncbi:MAG: type II toxin-antitoxin system VapC family toxin [Chloroflexota bacterium]|nr:type II toxin-antitoxin system VapC family toxin [Chloroflexota bacterium]
MTTGAEALVADAFVVDASVAVKWYLPDEEYREQANYLLARLSSGRTILAAPVLIRYEVPAVLIRAARRGRLSQDAARQAIQQFLQTGITTYHTPELITDAAPLAASHDLTLYDAAYLALARALTVPLITVDRQLAQLPGVVWLGDYSLAP